MLGLSVLFDLFYEEPKYITIEESLTSEAEQSAAEVLEENLKLEIAEVGGMDIESAESTAGSKNIEIQSKALASLKKAEAEAEKIKLQQMEIYERRIMRHDQLLTKLISIGAFALVTIFWISLEQGMPLPRLLVKLAEELVAPRRL